MKALVLKAYNQFGFEDVPTPKPGSGEVLVAVKACGICGSDVHGMDGSTGRRRPPIIMGHEAAGIIAERGPGVTDWCAGDRVTFDSTVYCGECPYCQRGQVNLCDHRRVLGVSCEEYRQDGAFAEMVVVPKRILYRLPESVSFEHAALVEPFAIAVHAINRSRPALNDTAVVIGAGMIGLSIIQVLKHTGCGQIIAVDIEPSRLALAAKFGAQTLRCGAEDPQALILELTRGTGADLTFEAVGDSQTVDLALRSVRKGGAVTLVGNVSPKVEFPLQISVTRELSVFGTCASRGEYPACIEMMGRGALDPTALISAIAPLSEGAAWFARLYRKEPGLLKVVLAP